MIDRMYFSSRAERRPQGVGAHARVHLENRLGVRHGLQQEVGEHLDEAALEKELVCVASAKRRESAYALRHWPTRTT